MDTTTNSPPPPKIELQSCPPDELAAWLCEHRFENNAMDTASFLLNCTAALPNAEEISAQLMGGSRAGEEDDEEDDDGGDEENDDGEVIEAVVVTEDNGTSPESNNAPPKKDTTTTNPHTQLLQSIIKSCPLPAFANNDNNNKNEAMEIEVSCTAPRGKFLLSLHQHGIVLANPKKRDEEQIPISSKAVENVIWFRKPEDYKKAQQMVSRGKSPPGHMVLICLSSAGGGGVGGGCGASSDGSGDGDGGAFVQFRNKALTQVCFQLPSYPLLSSTSDDNHGNDKQFTEEDWWNGLSSSLFSENNNGSIVRVQSTIDKPTYSKVGKGDFVFQSTEGGETTTTEGMPFVGCYHNLNDGALYPLREGLLFFKPPLFVRRSSLASISCGRGSGGSRYVDMVLQLDLPSDPDSSNSDEHGKKKKQSSPKDSLEFTNIHRDELSGLNEYIHNTLIPAMELDAGEVNDDTEEDEDDGVVAEVVATSDEDEEDANGSDASEEKGKRKRSSRAASKMAREATRAHFAGLGGKQGGKSAMEEEDDDDEEDEEEFREGDYESEGSEDGEDEMVSDEESKDEEDDSSDDEEFDGVESESDASDDDSEEGVDGIEESKRESKKARK